MNWRTYLPLVAGFACGSAILFSCTDLNITTVDGTVIQVIPESLTLSVGGSRQLVAEVRDARGNPLPDPTVVWSSSDPGMAVAEADGRVVGVAVGSVTITARSGSVAAEAHVVVRAGPAIGANPTSVAMSAPAGITDYRSSDVAITTTSGEVVPGLTTTVSYTTGQPTGWLRVIMTATSAPTTITLSAATASLAAGVYNATVRLTSSAVSTNSVVVNVRFELTPPAPAAPRPPSNLRANEDGRDRIELHWRDNSSDESEFVIERRAAAAGAWSFRLPLPANTTNHIDRNLLRDTRYWYRVLACNAGGCGASGVESARTRR
jgi:hypothetical protein